jgi:transmembrane sensor
MVAGVFACAALGISVFRMSGDTVAQNAPAPQVQPMRIEEEVRPSSPLGQAALVEERAQVNFLTEATRVRRLRPAGGRGARANVSVDSGAARFAVDKRKIEAGEAPFRVSADEVLVEVLGTVFTVDRQSPGVVAVKVDEGRVRVSWGTDGVASRLLEAGESGRFSKQGELVDAVVPEPEAAEPPTEAVVPTPVKASTPTGAWRQLARVGRYDAAFRALQRDLSQMSDVPHDLLLAADVARLSHHPEEAVAPLNRVVTHFARDDRAAPASFLLGRVLLENLGRASDAAKAFAQTRKLSPTGPLAEDALGREVEALRKAGQAAAASERAREYVKRYPGGARIHEIAPLAR